MFCFELFGGACLFKVEGNQLLSCKRFCVLISPPQGTLYVNGVAQSETFTYEKAFYDWGPEQVRQTCLLSLLCSFFLVLLSDPDF
jgi:hypothetical protein